MNKRRTLKESSLLHILLSIEIRIRKIWKQCLFFPHYLTTFLTTHFLTTAIACTALYSFRYQHPLKEMTFSEKNILIMLIV